MSDEASFLTETSILSQQLQSAERSIKFLQDEHASTLARLHEELTKLQQKCSHLSYQVAIGNTASNSFDDSKLRTTVERLEKELYQHKDQIKSLNRVLKEKEKIVNAYENCLTVNDRKHALELYRLRHKQRELKIELEQRSASVALLTNQLIRERQHQQNLCNAVRLGHMILPNKPRRLKQIDEQRQQYLSAGNRSSSVSNRTNSDDELTKVLFIGRRPPTPPQQWQLISSNYKELSNEQFFSKRQRQLLTSHSGHMESNKMTLSQTKVKVSTVLPPIVNRKIPLKAMTTIAFSCKDEL